MSLGPVRMPGMLLIGAAGRNAGKTELACRLIARESWRTPVVGVKLTTVHNPDEPCPRGSDGCGVCAEFQAGDAGYCITDEDGSKTGKDTSRLLAAGASRVLWVRASRECLAPALDALIEEIGQGTVCVCESNSLRHHVEPGVFLVVRHAQHRSTKPSCLAVLPMADAVLVSDGVEFSPSPDNLVLHDGRWHWRPTAPGADE